MKIIDLAKTVTEISALNIKHYLKKDKLNFDKEMQIIMKQVREQGYCLIPNFLDLEICTVLKKEIDYILEKYNKQLWKDNLEADKRAFGADRVSEEIKKQFYNNPLVLAAREAYYQIVDEAIEGFTMANRIESKKNNLGSGGGWHRDSVNQRQFKSILYLTDVSAQNGAFEYMTGTQHKETVLEGIIKYGFNYNHNRFTQEEIDMILSKSKHEVHTLTGKAGALILVDTSGIHRGSPIKIGTRYALTNYYFVGKNKGGKGIPENIEQILLKDGI